MNIQSFRVNGLHGREEVIHLSIEDNRIVVVGVNGIGKTTIMNLFYYLITQQWSSLPQIQFTDIEITIDDVLYRLSRADIEAFVYDIGRLRRRMPASIVKRIEAFRGTPAYFALVSGKRLSSAFEAELSSRLGVSTSTVRRIQADLEAERGSSPELFDERNKTIVFSEFLGEKMNSTVLYLPTYRRIERELKHLRRTSDPEDVQEDFHNKRRNPNSQVNYREMAEFGMADVELLIKRKCEIVNRIESDEFKDLIADYLSKVINNEVRNFDVSVIMGLSADEINRVLNRVQDENLKPIERRRIQEVISRISLDPLSAKVDDVYVGQLFFGLMKMAERLQREEQSINDFIKTINDNYLVNKKLVYARERRTITVVVTENAVGVTEAKEIKFSELSSGEKQIVSVFCHLYLGESRSYFVLIDEPELSLSIDWQEHFLNDILSTNVCSFLFAVTHSPFTFGGDLRRYRTELTSIRDRRV